MRLLKLTTHGARSGREHTVYVSYFPDGDGKWLIVASNSGSRRHPAWYSNLAKNPDKAWVVLEGRKARVRSESLVGAARETAWRRIVTEQPVYGRYEQKTDRLIPVVRLTDQSVPPHI